MLAELLVVAQVGGEGILQRLCPGLCCGTVRGDVVHRVADLAVGVVASTVIVVEHGVLGCGLETVENAPHELEVATEAVLGHLPVVESIVE